MLNSPPVGTHITASLLQSTVREHKTWPYCSGSKAALQGAQESLKMTLRKSHIVVDKQHILRGRSFDADIVCFAKGTIMAEPNEVNRFVRATLLQNFYFICSAPVINDNDFLRNRPSMLCYTTKTVESKGTLIPIDYY
jgi:hypothetical protein